MNLTQLYAAVQAKGYTSDTQAQQLIFLNEIYREVCGMARWPFLEAEDTSLVTVNGQPNYSLTSAANNGINLNGGAWRNIDSVRLEIAALNEFWNLRYLDPQSFKEMWQIDRDVTSPYYWTFAQQQLWFYPTPDQAYTVRISYIVEPADLAAGTDVPVIPAQYHDLLVWGCVCSLAFRERDWLGRQFAETKKEEMIKRLDEEYLVKQRQTGSEVKKSGYWETQMPYPFIHDGF